MLFWVVRKISDFSSEHSCYYRFIRRYFSGAGPTTARRIAHFTETVGGDSSHVAIKDGLAVGSVLGVKRRHGLSFVFGTPDA